jgi:hypothetical protein
MMMKLDGPGKITKARRVITNIIDDVGIFSLKKFRGSNFHKLSCVFPPKTDRASL